MINKDAYQTNLALLSGECGHLQSRFFYWGLQTLTKGMAIKHTYENFHTCFKRQLLPSMFLCTILTHGLLTFLDQCSNFINLDMQLVLGRRIVSEDSVSGDFFVPDEEFAPDPLCPAPPGIGWNCSSSDWVLRKVDEINECVGISFVGFEVQFRALLIAIEAGQPSLARTASKKESELKHLECSINYNARGCSDFREKGK